MYKEARCVSFQFHSMDSDLILTKSQKSEGFNYTVEEDRDLLGVG